ncbi:MAG: divergent polysaccharide deacetylase family protein [Candidatus Eisenbacteria bacterium]
MPSGRSKKARQERRARNLSLVRFSLVAAAIVVVVLLGAWELIASGRAAGLVNRFFGPSELTGRAAELNDAVDAALVSLGVTGVTSESEEKADERARWTWWDKSGTIPHGEGVFDCNLTVTRAVRDLGGRVVRVTERGPDWRGARTIEMRFGVGGVETHRIVLGESDPSAGSASPRAADDGPMIAIVIDDFGYARTDVVTGFLDAPFPLTISVLPGTPHGQTLAAAATRAGKEVLLHLPMEPASYPDTNPGDGALLLSHTHREIASLTRAAFDEIPDAKGVNNHMGSAFALDRARMRTVIAAVAERGLFYVDSMTTPQSRGYAEAERAGVPTVRNNMFIDSLLDEEGRIDVRTQLERLESIARKRGYGVGIGHPHPETLRALRTEVPRMMERGIRFVFVSELVN